MLSYPPVMINVGREARSAALENKYPCREVPRYGMAIRSAVGCINSMAQALASTSKGTSQPATIYAGQQWIDDDTPTSAVWTHNVYDGAQPTVADARQP